jgi:hypothetical protein
MDGDNSAFHPIIIINYSEWLQIWTMFISSTDKNVLLGTISTLALESTHPPTQLILRALSWLFTDPCLGVWCVEFYLKPLDMPPIYSWNLQMCVRVRACVCVCVYHQHQQHWRQE